MTAMQRTKGQAGEREAARIIADLTGWHVTRRVRQHGGDSDLVGIPGWSAEVKRHAAAGRAEIGAWWRQTVRQATTLHADADGRNATVCIPVLFYRLDRHDWQAMWPLACLLIEQRADMWLSPHWTATTSMDAWAAVARQIHAEQSAPC